MSDDMKFTITLISGIVIAILGWIVANGLASRRDQVNRHRNIRVEKLSQAITGLMNGLHDINNLTPEQKQKFTEALINLQLYGTNEMVYKAHEIMYFFAKVCNKEMNIEVYLAKIRKSLTELRDYVREELRVGPIGFSEEKLSKLVDQDLKRKVVRSQERLRFFKFTENGAIADILDPSNRTWPIDRNHPAIWPEFQTENTQANTDVHTLQPDMIA